MKQEYYVQFPDQSIINDFDFPKGSFASISIGIREIPNDFIFSLVHNMISFPVFFVLESLIFEHWKKVLAKSKFTLYEFSTDGLILEIDSLEKLKVVSEITEELARNGLSVYVFHGEGIQAEELIPSRHCNGPTLFEKLNIDKVDTFIDVEEVGVTIFSKNSSSPHPNRQADHLRSSSPSRTSQPFQSIRQRLNSPAKIVSCISDDYLLDVSNSDI